MTTAQYRQQAIELEANQEYVKAAHCWQEAIRAYPKHSGSALAASDLARMEERRHLCCMAWVG